MVVGMRDGGSGGTSVSRLSPMEWSSLYGLGGRSGSQVKDVHTGSPVFLGTWTLNLDLGTFCSDSFCMGLVIVPGAE